MENTIGLGSMREHLVTEASFDAREDFVARISRGKNTGESRERSAERRSDSRVSHLLSRVGQIGSIERGEESGQWYHRFGSHAEDSLCEQLVQAEAGYAESPENPRLRKEIGALVYASGMGAISAVLQELVRDIPVREREGKRFISGRTLYFNTRDLLQKELPRAYGIEPALQVDTTDPENVRAALEANRGAVIAIYYEPVTNPLLEYTDTRAIAEIAKAFGVPVIVDNTFLTPYLLQPFRQGADVVLHSLTKYANGEGDFQAGAVVGRSEFIRKLKTARTNDGQILSDPSLAITLAHRLSGLPERMDKHAENAQAFAEFLRSDAQPYVSEVYFPQLQDTRGSSAGGVLSFVLRGENDSERTQRESDLMTYIAQRQICQMCPEANTPLVYKTSFGESGHLILGETTFGYPPEYNPGLVRLAAGRTNVQPAISFLRQALTEVYRK
ncbi:TPA: PLP-dependent transferase [Candidatus Woesearchaeota archaeon]|nr:MAG: methionine-gamma-lyase [archaeon GW2011_AR16]HIG96115.1 PLP-dependent transferase [Candidatus Woesearchaeota archaeon]HII89248.1 PLP-dependent transferase [Candidatus Woesearchaeota archaeon]